MHVCCLVFFCEYVVDEVFFGVLMYVFHDAFGVFFWDLESVYFSDGV